MFYTSKKIILVIILLFFSINLYAQKLTDFLEAMNRTKDNKQRIKLIQQIPKMHELSNQDKLLIRIQLVKTFKTHPEPTVRKATAIALGELNLARQILESAFHDEDKIVRQGIIEGLATIAHKKSIQYFLFGYQQDDLITKNWSLIGISKTGDSRHLNLLIDAIGRNLRNINTTAAVLISIGRFGHKYKHWNLIKPYLNRYQKELVIAAIIAAAHLQNVKAIPMIAKHLTSKNIEISKVAITSLTKFHGYQPIKALVLFKHYNKKHPAVKLATYTLKNLKAAKYYAVLKHSMYLRKKYFKNARILATLRSNSLVEIIYKTKRKFSVLDLYTQKRNIDFWYYIKTESGKKGYLFGRHLTIIPTFK